MKSAGLGLNNPKDFLRYRAVLLSAPADMRRYGRAIHSASEFQPRQCLFGYDARLQLFAAALHRAGLKTWFIPAPDLFASDHSFAYLLKALAEEVAGVSSLVHLSFGMPWAIRILRYATNLAVLGGIAPESPGKPKDHPFGSGCHFPAALSGALFYDRLASNAWTSDGRELSTDVLDESFVEEPRFDQGSELLQSHPLDPRLTQGLWVQSVSEFETASWEGASSGTALQSPDFRRAFIRRNLLSAGQSSPLRFILIPWNLANPRSMVPDLAQRLSSNKERKEYEYGILLTPFNEDHSGTQKIRSLVEACRAQGTSGCVETIFLMRMASMQFFAALKRIVATCWLDGSDPEWQWNARRLSRLGFKASLIEGHGMKRPIGISPSGSEIDAVFPAEDSCVIHSNDELGEKILDSNTLSVRGMRRILQHAREARPRPVDGPVGIEGYDLRRLAREST